MNAQEQNLLRPVPDAVPGGENDVLVLVQSTAPPELALVAEGALLAAACGASARCVLLHGLAGGTAGRDAAEAATRDAAGETMGAAAGKMAEIAARETAPQMTKSAAGDAAGETAKAAAEATAKAAAGIGAAAAPAGAVLPDTGRGSAAAQREAYACLGAGAHAVSVLDTAACPDDLALAAALARVCRAMRPGTVLCNATVRGRAFMPMTAALLGTGLTADCIGLSMAPDGVLTQTRPAFGSHVTARIVCRTRPQMSTVRPGVFAPACSVPASPRAADTVAFVPGARVRETGFVPAQADGSGALAQAKIIFTGGLGVGGAEGFAVLARLAARCGGCVGATRAAVSAGYAPYAWQIGQTGIVVRPQLYVAVGVSGAVQHIAGMSGAKTVVAVNTDRRAPIFDYADHGIVGDWRETMETLEALLQKAGAFAEQSVAANGKDGTDEL